MERRFYLLRIIVILLMVPKVLYPQTPISARPLKLFSSGAPHNGITIQGPTTYSSAYTLTMPSGGPVINQLLISDGSGTLSWGLISNTNISNSAAIAYSKLNLGSSILNSDVSSSAAIAYSKLNLSNSIAAADITSLAVTTAKVADSAITGLKITSSAVTTNHIANTAITLPKISSSGASSGQVIGFNGSSVAWVSAPSVRMRAYRNSQQTINVGNPETYQTAVFNTEDYDVGNEYNTSTGVFTAAATGYYFVSAAVTWASNLADGRFIRAVKNGSTVVANGQGSNSTLSYHSTNVLSTVIALNSGDTLEIQIAGYNVLSSTTTIDAGTHASYCQITRIQ